MTGVTFGRRLGAYVIDGLMLWLITVVPFIMYNAVVLFGWGAMRPVVATTLLVLFTAVVVVAYWGSKGTARGSWGQRRMRIRLVNVDTGLPIGRAASCGRACVLSIVPFAPISIIFDSSGRLRGWHDLAAKSVVVDVVTAEVHALAAAEAVAVGGGGSAMPTVAAGERPPSPEPVRVTPVTLPGAAALPADATAPGMDPTVADAAAERRSVITSVPGMGAVPRPAQPAAVSGVDNDDEDLDSTRLTRAPRSGRELALVWDDGMRHPVTGSVTFGRNPTMGVGVPDQTRSLSKTHFTLAVTGRSITVTDEGSTNGTEVIRPDGTHARVVPGTPTPVAPGDQLVMGDRSCVIEVAR